MSAVPPAGGWTVLVAIIAIRLEETATGAATEGGSPKAATDPITALRVWPPMTHRGCEKGACGAPYRSTAVAPKLPRITVTDSISAPPACCSSTSVDTPIKAPPPAEAISFGLIPGAAAAGGDAG